MLSGNVLVLNRSFLPIHITNVKKAFCLLYRGIAKVVDQQYELFDFESWSALSTANTENIGLVNRAVRVPRVILLTYYDMVPKKAVRFSRLNIFIRDHNTCQYCGRIFQRPELNLDHVVPVSLGGKTCWENVVCSCVPCNLEKGGRKPQDAGMTLLKNPSTPHWSIYLRVLSKPVFYKEWRPFLNMVDFSYWNVELRE